MMYYSKLDECIIRYHKTVWMTGFNDWFNDYSNFSGCSFPTTGSYVDWSHPKNATLRQFAKPEFSLVLAAHLWPRQPSKQSLVVLANSHSDVVLKAWWKQICTWPMQCHLEHRISSHACRCSILDFRTLLDSQLWTCESTKHSAQLDLTPLGNVGILCVYAISWAVCLITLCCVFYFFHTFELSYDVDTTVGCFFRRGDLEQQLGLAATTNDLEILDLWRQLQPKLGKGDPPKLFLGKIVRKVWSVLSVLAEIVFCHVIMTWKQWFEDDMPCSVANGGVWEIWWAAWPGGLQCLTFGKSFNQSLERVMLGQRERHKTQWSPGICCPIDGSMADVFGIEIEKHGSVTFIYSNMNNSC